MYEKRRPRDIAPAVMLLFRFAIVAFFAIIALRLYQLQVRQGDSYQARADENRFQIVEQSAPRGVIYDRSGVILTRNRPSFEVALVPEDIPEDDTDTEEVDEEAQEIEHVLRLLRADSDETVALRVAEIMFRRLGRIEFQEIVEGVGVPLSFVTVPGAVEEATSNPGEPGDPFGALPALIEIPDISKPLPVEALTALVQRTIQYGRQGGSSRPIPILDLVERPIAFEVSEEIYRLPSVRVNQVPVREYPYADQVSHMLGFMGPIPAIFAEDYAESGYTNPNEKVGLSGLEYSYQTELRGSPGYKNLEVDILGREMRTVGQVADPIPGQNLILGTDLRLQRVMREALETQMAEKEAKWGVVIAMDPMTGLILGMVSLPSFDNNIFAEGINEEYLALERDERRPLINYAIGGLYPPGSTFKMTTAGAALQEGIIGGDDIVVDSGPLLLPNRFAPDDLSLAQPFVSWNHKLGINHGRLDVVRAMALSNDIYFYWIAGGYPPSQIPGLGARKLAEWTELFGYGDPTGIDLPGEVGTIVPNDQWKRQLYAESWTTGDSYNMGIGQGYVLATPLQVLVASAVVANGGKVVEPQVVYQITDANGGLQRDFKPIIRRELPISPENMALLQEGMWAAVNTAEGTSTSVKIDGITLAGKTGTAEFCEYIPEEQDCRRDDKDNLPTHAWFVAYGPYEAPEIAVVAFVYDGGEGSATAIPIARQVLEAYFREIAPRPPAEVAVQP
jgi:penicillin-binding protein 2